jgi:hypothetical protein
MRSAASAAFSMPSRSTPAPISSAVGRAMNSSAVSSKAGLRGPGSFARTLLNCRQMTDA